MITIDAALLLWSVQTSRTKTSSNKTKTSSNKLWSAAKTMKYCRGSTRAAIEKNIVPQVDQKRRILFLRWIKIENCNREKIENIAGD
jgi:hypothetical protein